MYKKLKQKTLEANLKLREYGLAPFTWGNASQLDRGRRYMAIKPSGVDYSALTANDVCVMDLEDGSAVDGRLNPSTDAPTHMELYRRFTNVFGIVHTHSAYATAFAQARRPIPCYGTTHADYFYGEIPCARMLDAGEAGDEYEVNTGRVIAEALLELGLDPLAVPGALISGHGPFAWGRDPSEAVHNAVVLEEVAKMAFITRTLSPGVAPMDQTLLDKHFLRKHGSNAYYGQ